MTRFSNVFLGILLASAGCLAGNLYIAGHDCSEFIAFFHKLPDDQVAEFSRFPLERKYIVYLCGNQFIHPPAQYLAIPLAQDVPNAVNFLKERLSQDPDDLTVRDIVLVFRAMKTKKTYDVASDAHLIRLLKDRVARMKDDGWKHISEQMIHTIVQ